MARAIVVGAGGISSAWFGPLKAEGVGVVAVVDLDRSRAEAAVAEHELAGAATFDDLDAALQSREADFVVDLTVPDAHCQVTCKSLEAGLHVIGEKPIASTIDEARRMVATAERTGKMYCISQSRRWLASWLAMRDAISAGRIGTLTTVHCDFMLGAHFDGFRAEMDHPLINDMAIHLFDGARMMTGCDPVAVYCSQFNPADSWYRTGASADCIFEMTDGVRFTFRGSWCSEGRHTPWEGNWRFVGTAGCILAEYDQPPMLHRATGEGFVRDCTREELPLPDVPYQNQHAALRELLAWLDGGPTPQGVCTDNIRSFIMTTAAAESAETGRRVAISTR